MTRSPGVRRLLPGVSAALLGAAVLGSGLLAAGCTPPSPDPRGAPSGPTGAGAPTLAGPTGPPAPTGPFPLPGLVVEARIPGGAGAVPLDPAGAPVDPASTFELRVSAPVRGARLVLLDAQDAMVPAGSEAERGAVSRFTLVPLEPLRPGSRYQLRLEGVESRLVRSEDGRSFEPAAIPLTTTGEPPPKAPPPQGREEAPPLTHRPGGAAALRRR